MQGKRATEATFGHYGQPNVCDKEPGLLLLLRLRGSTSKVFTRRKTQLNLTRVDSLSCNSALSQTVSLVELHRVTQWRLFPPAELYGISQRYVFPHAGLYGITPRYHDLLATLYEYLSGTFFSWRSFTTKPSYLLSCLTCAKVSVQTSVGVPFTGCETLAVESKRIMCGSSRLRMSPHNCRAKFQSCFPIIFRRSRTMSGHFRYRSILAQFRGRKWTLPGISGALSVIFEFFIAVSANQMVTFWGGISCLYGAVPGNV